MDAIQFEWDERKNEANRRKHGLSFELARRIFLDPLRTSVLERIVGDEERWQTFGLVNGRLLLMVAHLSWDELDEGKPVELIRIISARRATARERQAYEQDSE